MPVIVFILIMLYLFLLTKSVIFIFPVVFICLLCLMYSRSSYKCHIDNCNKEFKTLKELVEHIKKEHIDKGKNNE